MSFTLESRYGIPNNNLGALDTVTERKKKELEERLLRAYETLTSVQSKLEILNQGNADPQVDPIVEGPTPEGVDPVTNSDQLLEMLMALLGRDPSNAKGFANGAFNQHPLLAQANRTQGMGSLNGLLGGGINGLLGGLAGGIDKPPVGLPPVSL